MTQRSEQHIDRRSFLKLSALAAASLTVPIAHAATPNNHAPSIYQGSKMVKKKVVVAGDIDIPRVKFGIGRLESAFNKFHTFVVVQPLGSTQTADIVVEFGAKIQLHDAPLMPEGYQLSSYRVEDADQIHIAGADATGAMYGLLDVAEYVRAKGSLQGIGDKKVTPRFPFRAIKFNLPWMSYRKGEALQLHFETCRDLRFWATFLDMMADTRYNALTLWNLHPFSFMIRPTNFPEACAFNDSQLSDWQKFWRSLFAMAKDRGIETYMVNWNTFVSPEFAKAHGVAIYSEDWGPLGDGDPSELIKRYIRECVTQVIDEYSDLTGLGITLGERMGGMTPLEREDWLIDTFGEGIKAASRRIKFIHRAPLSADKGSSGSTGGSVAQLTRDAIGKLDVIGPTMVELKFNWSHAYSSPKLLSTHGGTIDETYWTPPPANYKLAWMIRNEDFFILRWGDPEFARRHIAMNGHDYVGGYFIGSECYIPAKNYLDKPPLPDRLDYAFQRQWLLYMIWGRLLYDPETPNSVFEDALSEHCGTGTGKPLLSAYALASQMPMQLATFHGFTWDFTLYSEGFLAPSEGSSKLGGGKHGFITVEDLIKCKPIDLSFLGVREYVVTKLSGSAIELSRTTPLMLAANLERDGNEALSLIDSIPSSAFPELAQNVADIRAWSYLSHYFAAKLRAAVALETFRQNAEMSKRVEAVNYLNKAVESWDNVIGVTKPIYDAVPLLMTQPDPFSWESYRDAVLNDISIANA